MACKEQPYECTMIWGTTSCWVFIKTTQGEETILLARQGFADIDEAHAVLTDFIVEYGEGNVSYSVNDPHYHNCNIVVSLDEIPDCYEITMVLDFEKTSVPLPEVLLRYREFRAVRADGPTRMICKFYDWAFTEERATTFIQHYENLYSSLKVSKGGGGTILSTTIKKLGPEVANSPIIF